VDVGNQALSAHLGSLIALMKVADNWSEFYQMVEKAFPKRSVKELESVLTDEIE